MMGAIGAIARRELLEAGRGRWLWLLAALYGALALAVAYGCGVVAGDWQWPPLVQLQGALVTLCSILLPLFALLLAADAFVAEMESGTMLLLFTYPLSRSQWLAGKLLGQSSALLLANAIGLSVLLLLPVLQAPFSFAQLWPELLRLLLSGWLLSVLCLLAGYRISLRSRSRNQALAWVLLLWLLLVLLYDLALLILAVLADGSVTPSLLLWLQWLNPASAFRLMNNGSELPSSLLYGQAVPWLLLLWWLACNALRWRPL